MPIDKSIKSNRLLQSKRYTQQQLGDAQEAFTSVLDINSSEVYAQQSLIPTSSLIYSGSSQNGQFVTSNSYNILKFYYRQRLTPSDTLDTGSYNTWFFLDPTASIDYTNGVNAGVLNTRQQGNFISPKYAPALGGNTEDTTPGYQVKLTDSTGTIIDPAVYTFDYKDGVLQFNGSSGYSNISTQLYLTAYQYVGKTLGGYFADSGSFDSRINTITGSFSTTGSVNSFTASIKEFSASVLLYTASQNDRNGTYATTGSNIFKGNQTITGSLSVSGSTNIYGTTNVTGSVNVSGSTGTAITANVDTIVFTGSYAQSGSATIAGNLTVTDTITAQRLIVQTITSSIIYSSGSNIFGDTIDDTQTLIGSVIMSGSMGLTGNASVTGSFFVNGYQFSPNQIATGSITASVSNDPTNLFLIKSGSTQYLNISSSSNTTLYSNLFIVKNFTTQQPVLTVSQSIVQIATQSFNPSGTTDAGSIWFTSSSMYIGLEN